jgi:F0F1-type ATP synthase assembly protein I
VFLAGMLNGAYTIMRKMRRKKDPKLAKKGKAKKKGDIFLNKN